MGKVVENKYYCDVCGKKIKYTKPIPRAIKEIGYYGDYRFKEYSEPRFCIKDLYLCEECKTHSDNRLIGMTSEMGSEHLSYKWLEGQEAK